MSAKKVAITLPEELFHMVERMRQIEHRSRSEVIQEALRTHFGEPVYTPTEDERRLLAKAQDELERGEDPGRSWDVVRGELDSQR